LDEQQILRNIKNLEHKSTIQLVLRLRGGIFINISCGNEDYKKIETNNVDIDLDQNFDN
jgi:hypothetical protein